MLRANLIGYRLVLVVLLLGVGSAQAQQLEDRLVIVTSFSKDLTGPLAQAFEKKHPGTRVEVQNRNTAAAVAFIRETRSNPPDIMWASAPDAFEVLKKNELLQKYAPKIALGSFSQMGFVEASIATKALMDVQGDFTAESVNAAFKNVKGYETDILCKPWYYGEAPLHIPNNTDWTTTPKDGKMVIQEDCFEISDADPDIAKARQIEQEQGIG